MKKSLIVALSVLAIAGVVTGTLYWNADRNDAKVIQLNLLPPPSTKGLHPELAERIVRLNQRAIDGPDRFDSLVMLSRIYHANGYLNRAWQNYRILIEIDGENPLWYHRLATIVSGYGQLSDALGLYRKAMDLDGNYIPTRIHYGDTLLKLNRVDEAKSAFQSILNIEPDNPFALFGQARVFLARNDIARAKYFLESARHSNNRLGGDLLADIYEQLGETAKARTLLREVNWSSHIAITDPWVDEIVDVCYDSFEVAMAGGKAGRAGDATRAIQLLEKSVSLDPLDHNAYNHLAELYLIQGNMDKARESYESCTKVLPAFAEGWAGLISIEKKSGIPTKASELIEKALAYCPNSHVINNYKGESLLSKNRPQEAIPYFETAIRNFPHNAVGYNYLASAHLKLGQNEKALEQLEKALKAEPGNPLALKLITIFYILADNPIQAESYLNEAVISPRISEEVVGQLQMMFKSKFE